MGTLIAIAGNARYVMFSLIIILFQIVLTSKSFINKFRTLIIIIISGSFLLFFLSLWGYDISLYFSDRVFSKESDSARITAYEIFLKEYPKFYLFGAGKPILGELLIADRVDSVPLIHIGYLSHLYQYGLIGSFLLIWFWSSIIKKIYSNAKKVRFWGSFFAFIAFFFANTTFVYMNIFTYGLIIALIYSKHYKREYELNKQSYYKMLVDSISKKNNVNLKSKI
jgi:hypothetical protein